MLFQEFLSFHSPQPTLLGLCLAVNRSDSTYYLTFEVEGGERLEFKVSGQIYGQHTEGDVGKLIFKGKRFQGFERVVRGYENIRALYRHDA